MVPAPSLAGCVVSVATVTLKLAMIVLLIFHRNVNFF